MLRAKFNDDNILEERKATDRFTDRLNYIKAFRDFVQNKPVDDISVMSFYGIGGIGKTALINKLVELIEPEEGVLYCIHNFEAVENRNLEAFLLNLRSRLIKKM